MSKADIYCVTLEGEGMDGVAQGLQQDGWHVVQVSGAAAAVTQLSSCDVGVGLMRVGGVQESSLRDIERCLQACPDMEWVALCDEVALESASFRALVLEGFFDYQSMPLDWGDMQHLLQHMVRRVRLRAYRDCAVSCVGPMGMVGASPPMQQLRRAIKKVAATQASVLISGESGTGKELAARAIHECSVRRTAPFIAVNCAAIAPSLIQSELFGHERGSFTGAVAQKRGLIEMAQGGTLFLDEIGDLPLDLQANLLRFLQNKTISRVGGLNHFEVDVRVVSASHVDLADAVTRGRFREDLFYRLNVLTLAMPPLRERMEDVPLLARHFFAHCANDRSVRLQGFSRQALAAMADYSWPGNVRELCNRVQRAVVMSDARWITAIDLGLAQQQAARETDLDGARTHAEREVIRHTLLRVGHNITHAARELGVSRMTLYRLMDKHGLAPMARNGFARMQAAVP